MARRQKPVTIEQDSPEELAAGKQPNRDAGKKYLLTEMPATQAEKWAMRTLMAMASSGIQVPKEAMQAGMKGVARMGIQAMGGMRWELAEPLMDEMFECVSIPLKAGSLLSRPLVEEDIEEVSTRLKLRLELLELHLGFTIADKIQILGLSAKDKKRRSTTKT